MRRLPWHSPIRCSFPPEIEIGVRESEFHAMLEADEHHWWYRGRRHVLAAELGHLRLPQAARILDAGCGSGRTLDELAPLGAVSGVDKSVEAVEMARARGHADVHVAPVERLPWPDATFDLVTCLDVIEHTDDDRTALAELHRVSRPLARLVLTVPAYPLLWSSHDVANQHRRRYLPGTLTAAAEAAGWAHLSDTFFNTLLLPPAAAVRLAERLTNRRERPQSHLALTTPRLNRVLELPMRAEAQLLARGGRLRAGLSLLAVFRRADGSSAGAP
jgi:SAM-dependent methyltransferase